MKDAPPSGFRIRGFTSAMRLRLEDVRCNGSLGPMDKCGSRKLPYFEKLCLLNSTSTETMRSCVTESVQVTFHRKSSEDNFRDHRKMHSPR